MVATRCQGCGAEVSGGQNFCPVCGIPVGDAPPEASKPKPARRRRRLRPRTIRILGYLISSAIGGATTAAVIMILTNNFTNIGGGPPINVTLITPQPFSERSEFGRVNASDLVPLSDSKFLVIDDLTDDAFYELSFEPDGQKSGLLIRRPIAGLTPGLVEDLEGATSVDVGGKKNVIAVSSMENNEGENTDAGLVRVAIGEDGGLTGVAMAGFRTWLISNVPAFEGLPSIDALDVQGLTWDPERNALLLGVRFPSNEAGAIIVPVKVKDWNGAWETSNLEVMPPIHLQVPDGGMPKGILGIARHPDRGDYLVIVGNAKGKAKNAELYVWSGDDSGVTKRVTKMLFHPGTKPAGLAFGPVAGRPAVVVVDDDGGYYLLWQDEFDKLLGK